MCAGCSKGCLFAVGTGSPPSFGTVLNPQPTLPGPQRVTCATTFGAETFNTFFAPPLYAEEVAAADWDEVRALWNAYEAALKLEPPDSLQGGH